MSEKMPPWLQEQIVKMQQLQQNLQAIMSQRQHLEMEQAETAKALEELQKVPDADNVYKFAGPIMLKSTKHALIAELEEKRELGNTRSTVLEKQEARVKESIKEQEANITSLMQQGQPGSTPGSVTDPGENPRK